MKKNENPYSSSFANSFPSKPCEFLSSHLDIKSSMDSVVIHNKCFNILA